MEKTEIPRPVLQIAHILESAGFKAYLVGGCVRDLLRGAACGELVEPKDWDIATDAKPEKVQELFPDSVYENNFGTVLVKLGPRINADKTPRINADESESIRENLRLDPRESASLKTVEVTTFRIEGKYTDKRHPDEVRFAKTIEEDLSRRDFTVNAMALALGVPQIANREAQSAEKDFARDARLAISDSPLVDPFDGQKDLKNKIIRAVGDANERFNEDALRMARAVRFAVELGFSIEPETRRAITLHSNQLEYIAKERVRDELIKIIMCPRAGEGMRALEELGLLKFVLPELREGVGVSQNRHHIYSIFDHNIRALEYATRENYSLEVRLASLFHDVGKPRSKAGEGPSATFYQHEYIGARLVFKMLDRLHFPREVVERVAHLVRCHMFYYNTDEVSAAGVRRFLARVGVENIDDIMRVREADRIGSGVPKAVVYKMRHLLYMIEKVRRDPVSPKMLAVDGNDVMKLLDIPPSPRVGFVLAALLEEVLDDPGKNMKENLELRIEDLGKLSDAELKKLAEKSKARKEEFEKGADEEIRKRHRV